jgi:hypothetical protein
MLEYPIIVSLSWIWLISDIWLSETPLLVGKVFFKYHFRIAALLASVWVVVVYDSRDVSQVQGLLTSL